ncbi:MAG: hypothetical protein QM658_10515 [Gordonia sp. (in: high G+C Gram-positive bacteria)]
MTNSFLLPPLVRALCLDPEFLAQMRPMPPTPSHAAGSTVPGCTRFPVDWPPDRVARFAERVARDPESNPDFAYTTGTYALLDDSGAGFEIITLVRETADGLRAAACLPRSLDRQPSQPAGPIYNQFRRQLATILRSVADSRQYIWAVVGDCLFNAGEIAESLNWFYRSVPGFSECLPEGVHATMFALALNGVFDEMPYTDLTTVVELTDPWIYDFPETWGLRSWVRDPRPEIDIEDATNIELSTVGASAQQWCNAIIDLGWPEMDHPPGHVAATWDEEARTVTVRMGAGTSTAALGVEGEQGARSTILVSAGAGAPSDLAKVALCLSIDEQLPADSTFTRDRYGYTADVSIDAPGDVLAEWLVVDELKRLTWSQRGDPAHANRIG